MNEYTGRTVSEAIAAGLKDLNLTAETAHIEVLDEGHSGVFGLGSLPAVVRISALKLEAEAVAETEQVSEAQPAAEAAPEPEPQIESQPQAEPEPQTEPEPQAESEPVTTDADDLVLTLSSEFLQRMLDLMHLQTQVEATLQPPQLPEDDPVYYLNILGEDLGILIGRR